MLGTSFHAKLWSIGYRVLSLYSLMRSLKQLDIRGTIVNRPEELKKLDGLFLPGVGAFKSGMDTLNKNHMLEPIIEYVQVGKPLLGICLGMQLLLWSF